MDKLKPVELPEYNNVPRWLVLQGEIDLRLFIIEKMKDEDARKAPINRMVDGATGYDKKILSDAEEIIAELRWLKAEYDKETDAPAAQLEGSDGK